MDCYRNVALRDVTGVFLLGQVIMLGRYNAQGLGERVEAVTKEFVVCEGKSCIAQTAVHVDILCMSAFASHHAF